MRPLFVNSWRENRGRRSGSGRNRRKRSILKRFKHHRTIPTLYNSFLLPSPSSNLLSTYYYHVLAEGLPVHAACCNCGPVTCKIHVLNNVVEDDDLPHIIEENCLDISTQKESDDMYPHPFLLDIPWNFASCLLHSFEWMAKIIFPPLQSFQLNGPSSARPRSARHVLSFPFYLLHHPIILAFFPYMTLWPLS